MSVDWDAVDPQWRVEFVPRNGDGDAGQWYTLGRYDREAEVLEALANCRADGLRFRVQERWVTQWQEPEYIGETYVGGGEDE
jgi:hypothetical protein